MDFNGIIARVKGVLAAPRTEWPRIAEESATVRQLYLGYIMLLAAIPPLFGFLSNSVLGHNFMGVHVRVGMGAGIGSAILEWILALVGVYIVAWIVNALASNFAGQANQVQAFKLVAYAYTASWVAGVGAIIPWIGWLIMIAGGIYSIYLLRLGLPATMKCPEEKAAGYTAVTILCAIAVYIVIALIVGSIIAGSGAGAHFVHAIHNDSTSAAIDKNSSFGKLAALGKSMEAAGKSGSGNTAAVEAVTLDKLKSAGRQ